MCFIGNSKAFQDLLAWLQRPPPEHNRFCNESVLFIVGAGGTGKTYGVQTACKDLGLVLKQLDTQTVGNFKEFHDIFVKMCASDITTQFRMVQKDRIVLCLDELDALIALDRTFFSSFQKLMQDHTLPHVSLIITTQHLDQRKELSLQSRTIVLYPPSEADMIVFLRQLAPSVSMQRVLQIAETCNGNVGYAKQLLQLTSLTEQNSTSDGMDHEWKLEDIYANPCISVARYVFSEDPWINPLRFHENLASEWKQRKGSLQKKRTTYLHLLGHLCLWDLMMCHFKGDESTIPIEILSASVCKIKDLERKTKTVARDDFTKVFSHLSLEKKNMVSLESAGVLKDGLHSYHKTLYDSVFNEKASGKGKREKFST